MALKLLVLDERLPGFPIVLHGSSSVPQDYVKMVNSHGGKMPDAVGIPEEELRKAATMAVCKINIDSDLRLAMTGTIRKYFTEHPDHFDPRQYLKPARENIKQLVKHKLIDVLEEVSRRLPGFPIVLHGSSSVPQEYVKMINDNGGKMPNAIGVPEEQLREAAKLSVCKINIDSDLRLAMTGTIRQFFNEHPDKFDPREYLKPARANIKELVRHKLRDVLGCAGKA